MSFSWIYKQRRAAVWRPADTSNGSRSNCARTGIYLAAIELDAMIEVTFEPRLPDAPHAACPDMTEGLDRVGFAHKFGAEKRCNGSVSAS